MQTARARRFIVFTVVAAATLLSTSCLTSPDTAVSFETSWRNELAKTSVVGASYAVFDDSSLIQTGAYGWADREAGTRADASTPYLIGSVTKVFTAIAVMQLSDRGLVDIDQPLRRYLPEFSLRDGGESITVRQVLTHHAGLPSDVYRHKFSISPPRFDAVLDHLRRQDACAPPGMIYSYSNLGYALLGLMIERVARMPYETFMERSIFEPLGMVDTSFYSTYAADAGFATPYDSAGNPVEEYPIYDVPAGAIVSTAGDMARFGQALLAGGSPILLNDTTAELFRAQNMDVALDLDDRVGLAFNLTPKARENGTVGEHGGATLFHRAQIYLAPDAGLGAVILSNSPSGVANAWRFNEELLVAIAKERGFVAPRSLPPLKEVPLTSVADKDLASFAGTYAAAGAVFTFAWRNQRLYTEIQGRKFYLMPEGDASFVPAIEILGLSFPYRKRWFFLEQIGGERVFLEAMPWGDIVLTAQQVKIPTISPAWLRRIGSYTAVNTAPGDVEMIRDVEIASKGDFLVLRYGFNPSFGDAPSAEFGLRVTDDREARIMGLGRGAGEGVHVVTASDGSEHLFYFGLELERR